jgi:hypothetical protein
MDPLEPNPYEVLGLPQDASQSDIKNKHRKLVLKCHPDIKKDESLKAQKHDEFHRIQRAYEILSDETRRATYEAEVTLARLRKDKFARGEVERKNKAADERRMEFLAFALKLYDERAALPESTPHDQMPTPTPAPQPETTKQAPVSIEEDIKERNRLYEKLREVDGSGSPHSKFKPEIKPLKKEILHAVPVDQLNLEIMNPERNDVSVDIVAVHGVSTLDHVMLY